MKAKPSNLKPEVRKEQGPVLPLTVESWEEEFFTLPVRATNGAVAPLDLNWDDIEAVGAADDASRFRIEEPLTDTAGVCP